MQRILNFFVRLFLLAAALVFAACLMVLAAALLLVWALRYGWARLTGRAPKPFVFRMDPRAGFGRVYRPGSSSAPPEREGPAKVQDVTDVEPRELSRSARSHPARN